MSHLPLSQARPPAEPSPSIAKSVLDRALAVVLLLLIGLWLGLIALAIWLTDDGPLLTRDARIGQHGRRIDLLRFRTSDWRGTGARESAGRPASTDRGTSVGRAVRGRHLDVLLRLVNVVRGDVSLVGPPARRPDDPRAWLHPAVRPGLIRPWSATTAPRSDAEEVTAVRRYLRTWSPVQDLALLWGALNEATRPDPRRPRAAG
jgi:lipopolysaccharide/colanic/teichoic acid biosynthesis glycosyltransferase